MCVVAEFGLVNLKGKSVTERARVLIGIAHPDFRDELERRARECRLIPKSIFQGVTDGSGSYMRLRERFSRAANPMFRAGPSN